METALLTWALPLVLAQLKDMFSARGYMVEVIQRKEPVLIAYQEGTWYKSSRQVVFHLSKMDEKVTRIDVTAIIDSTKSNRQAEEIVEEKIVEAIYQNFKSTTGTHHGI